MRLLTWDPTGNLRLVDANQDQDRFDTDYAILSHTWGNSVDEVTYTDVEDGSASIKAGYRKLEFVLEEAKQAGLAHAWVDSCCIDRRSKTELEKSINLMYKWYAKAKICFVYLADFSASQANLSDGVRSFEQSRWFTRGWTLQELLAPRVVEFYDRDGHMIGTRSALAPVISAATTIPTTPLIQGDIRNSSINSRYQWAHKRQTTEPEDRIYCLFGLLDVTFPVQYGVGYDFAKQQLLEALSKQYGIRVTDQLRATIDRQVGQELPKGDEETPDLQRRLYFEQAFSRRDAIEHQLWGTCAWLLEHPAFKAWQTLESVTSAAQSSFLWLKGHPGAGKSTLLRYADREVSRYQARNISHVTFYFSARGAELERTTIGMYRSMLFQLLEMHPELEAVIVARAKASQLSIASSDGWALYQLKELFLFAAEEMQSNLRIFVDALDECSTLEIQDMVAFFRDLNKRYMANGKVFLVCLASRYYPTLSIRDSVEIRLDQQPEQLQDLRAFVHERLDALDYDHGDGIREEVVQKANGSFIWAVLVISIMNEAFRLGDIHKMRAILHNMPPELDGVYKEIIQRKDGTIERRFKVCMQLVLFSHGPLSANELYSAILFDMETKGKRIEDTDSTLLFQCKASDTERFIISASRGLAEIKHHTVQVIHESVRDYFLRHGGLSAIIDQHGSLQWQICWAYECLKRLCQRVVLYAHRVHKYHVSSKRLPYLGHALVVVLYYAEQAASQVDQAIFVDTNFWKLLFDARQEFTVFDHDFIAAHKYLETSYHIPEFRSSKCYAVHCFAQEGAINLMSTAARLGYDINVLLDSMTPLQRVMHGGWFDLGLQLLLYGANPHGIVIGKATLLTFCASSCLDPNGSHDNRVWGRSWIQRRGSHSREASIWRPPKARTPHGFIVHQTEEKVVLLPWEYTPTELLRLVLFYGANPNELDRSTYTPLMLAGDIPSAQVLISHGAAVDRISPKHGTALITACKSASTTELVKYLLSCGASTDLEDGQGQTALMQACLSQSLSTIKLLLTARADVDIQDRNGQTALLLASSCEGSQPVVLELLRAGARVDQRNTAGETALMHASAIADVGIVSTLLAWRASPNLTDTNGRTALMRVATPHTPNMGASLLEGGPCSSSDCHFLQTAAWLLEHGADPGMCDSEGNTARRLGLFAGTRHRCRPLIIDRIASAKQRPSQR